MKCRASSRENWAQGVCAPNPNPCALRGALQGAAAAQAAPTTLVGRRGRVSISIANPCPQHRDRLRRLRQVQEKLRDSPQGCGPPTPLETPALGWVSLNQTPPPQLPVPALAGAEVQWKMGPTCARRSPTARGTAFRPSPHGQYCWARSVLLGSEQGRRTVLRRRGAFTVCPPKSCNMLKATRNQVGSHHPSALVAAGSPTGAPGSLQSSLKSPLPAGWSPPASSPSSTKGVETTMGEAGRGSAEHRAPKWRHAASVASKRLKNGSQRLPSHPQNWGSPWPAQAPAWGAQQLSRKVSSPSGSLRASICLQDGTNY